MVTRALDLSAFEAQVQQEDGPFYDHLHRLGLLLARDAELCDAVRAVLRGAPSPTAAFYRLRSAGVLLGDSPESARPRCQLYRVFLERHLR
jgi:hypothetical protein